MFCVSMRHRGWTLAQFSSVGELVNSSDPFFHRVTSDRIPEWLASSMVLEVNQNGRLAPIGKHISFYHPQWLAEKLSRFGQWTFTLQSSLLIDQLSLHDYSPRWPKFSAIRLIQSISLRWAKRLTILSISSSTRSSSCLRTFLLSRGNSKPILVSDRISLTLPRT